MYFRIVGLFLVCPLKPDKCLVVFAKSEISDSQRRPQERSLSDGAFSIPARSRSASVRRPA